MDSSVVDFSKIFEELEAEQLVKEDIRNDVRDLDRKSRTLTAQLNKAHSRSREESESGQSDAEKVKEVLASSQTLVGEARQQIAIVASRIKPGDYYKYNDIWSRSVQQTIFCIVFIGFLEDGRLVSIEEVKSQLAISALESTGFFLPIEEYLHALVSLTNELSRLAVNSVTLSDYERPHEISKFVKDLYGSFQILNLKNDSLRKRFDSIKYDVKKIEEVVYDISLRGLTAQGKAAVEKARLGSSTTMSVSKTDGASHGLPKRARID